MEKLLEDKLRKAACEGDIDVVIELILKGTNVNARQIVNGWTPLHWAAKRGWAEIVRYLLEKGADPNILNENGETPANLASSPEVRKILGADMNGVPNETTLPITPNYIKNPPITSKDDFSSHWTNGSIHRRQQQPPPEPIDGEKKRKFEEDELREQRPKQLTYDHQLQFFKIEEQKLKIKLLELQLKNENEISALRKKKLELEIKLCSDKMKLVLKVRVANGGDPDFIEVELPRNELTYYSLLRVCCEELGLNASQVVRIRKLPNTMLRKDKDVQRLCQMQEIEVVVTPSSAKHQPNGYKSIQLYKNQTILY